MKSYPLLKYAGVHCLYIPERKKDVRFSSKLKMHRPFSLILYLVCTDLSR